MTAEIFPWMRSTEKLALAWRISVIDGRRTSGAGFPIRVKMTKEAEKGLSGEEGRKGREAGMVRVRKAETARVAVIMKTDVKAMARIVQEDGTGPGKNGQEILRDKFRRDPF